MQLRHAALTGALGILTVGAHAQSMPTVAQSGSASSVAAASAGYAMLRNGTPVPLRLMETLTTKGKNLRAGYRFRLETAEAVTVDGNVVIPIGSPAVGEITEVRNKGMWGKSGKFAGRILYVSVNGRQVRVSGQLDDKGSAGGVGAVAVSALVFLPAGFFMTGTSASLPIGAPVQAFVGEDVAVAFTSPVMPMTVAARPALATATPAEVITSAPMTRVAVTPAVVATAVVSRPVSAAPVQPVVVATTTYGLVASNPAPVAMVAAVQPAAQPVSGMSASARRYAQREDYIRLVGQMGLSPAAAMASVESKYGMPME